MLEALDLEIKTRPLYYDRQGNPITIEEFCILCEDKDKREVKKDVINQHLVSTIFIGMDMGFLEGEKPLIFETMIFKATYDNEVDWSGASADHYQERYSTEEEALEGHKEAIKYVLDRVTVDTIEVK